MTLSDEQVLAGRVLRLLLDEAAPDAWPLDWSVLLPLARRNGTLLRVADRLAARAPAPPTPVVDAIATERRRAREAFALVRHVTRICTKHGIEFLFAKAFQHYPDVGGDLDLLVLAHAADVDALLARDLPATAAPRHLSGRIAGSVAFRVRDVITPLDVQHGRVGTVGEHRAYAVTLVRNRRRIVIEGTEFAVPRPEDQLVLQGAQRIYGRRSFRLCDVAYTVSSLRHDRLDWEYILSTASRIGVLPGLGCYLGYVEQIQREWSDDLLVPTAVRNRLPLAGWGRIEFTRGAYRFPAVRVNGRLYLKQLVAGLRAANWDGAARLCLLPLVGAAVALERVATARSRSAESA